MSGIFSFLFGGTDDSAQDAQIAANANASELIRQKGEQARRDVLSIFPAAEQAQQQGFQAAANVLGQSIPEQARLFDLGNQAAQRTETQGLAGFREAILGLPQDFSQANLQQGIGPLTPSFGFGPSEIQIPRPFLSDELGLDPTGGTTPAGFEELLRQLESFGFNQRGEFGEDTEGADPFDLIDAAAPNQTPQSTSPTIRDQTASRTLSESMQTVGTLVDRLLADESIPIEVRANRVLDEAQRLGLTPQQLADSSPLITMDDVRAALSGSGRAL